MVLKWACPKPHGASSCLHTNTTPSLRAKNQKQKGEIDVKKIISIALALLMVAVMLPVMAMAVDATEVSTQEALKNAVVAGGNIKLTSDIDLNGSMVIEIDGKLTIDLNGHSIKNNNGAAIILKKVIWLFPEPGA